MKKTVKIIYPVLLLNIFLLFNILLIISQQYRTKNVNTESVSFTCSSVDFNSAVTQLLLNEEESDNFENEYIVSIEQLLFYRENLYTLERTEIKDVKCFQHSVFELRSDLPPPKSGVLLI